METLFDIQPGDRVTCLVHGGLNIDGSRDMMQRSGRCVLAFDTHVVLNMGGRHGTPQVVDTGNYVSHRKARR